MTVRCAVVVACKQQQCIWASSQICSPIGSATSASATRCSTAISGLMVLNLSFLINKYVRNRLLFLGNLIARTRWTSWTIRYRMWGGDQVSA